MLPYLLVLGFVTFWIALEKTAVGRKSFWLPLLVLSLFAGMRSYRVGTDSGTYTRKFVSNLSTNYYNFREDVEIGYQLYEYLILKFTHNYFWLFFLSGLIVVYCYLYIIKRYSVNYLISVILFVTLGVYTFFFNGLRQGLAMAIFALSLPYLLERKFFYYLLVCIIASLFHKTALIMIPFYFLVNLRIKALYKILATFLCSLILSGPLVGYISSTNERYETYSEVAEKSGGILTLGFYVILLAFIYFIIRHYKVKDQQVLKMFVFYSMGVVFLIPIAMLGSNPSGPQRLLIYFAWTLILILPAIFKKINNVYITSVSVMAFIIYFILTTSRFSNLTPYIINSAFEIF